jgi:DNA-binding MarR family transcriptional regulator
MNEKSIGRLVSILYRRGLNHTGKQFKSYGIGSGQFAFLAELFAQDGISQEKLASAICCDKATVARAMQRLESLGYIERKRSVEDGRVKLVYLTGKAHNFKPTLFSVLSNWTDTLAQGLSSDERELVINLLNRLVENAIANRPGE